MHVFPPGGDPFFREIQAVYDEIGEPLGRRGWPQPRELPDERGEIVSTGLFDDASVTQFDWEVTYDAEGYIDLLETFSGHISMQPWQRERLHAEIRRRLAERPGGRVRRHWGAALHIARRARRRVGWRRWCTRAADLLIDVMPKWAVDAALFAAMALGFLLWGVIERRAAATILTSAVMATWRCSSTDGPAPARHGRARASARAAARGRRAPAGRCATPPRCRR